jgi:hypothetical protein
MQLFAIPFIDHSQGVSAVLLLGLNSSFWKSARKRGMEIEELYDYNEQRICFSFGNHWASKPRVRRRGCTTLE